ncbi:MAG: arsenate reductase (glutaredoxin) [Hellea sp.]|nr:arsenate reductase (glutaredoxin) [Hellea sp.]
MHAVVKIYHNPRCSKSRQTLQLIRDNGIEPEIVLYLDTSLTPDDIQSLIQMLGLPSARDLMRRGEAIYKDLDLKKETDENALIKAMAAYPKLIERPIVIHKGKAVLGRPPENILDII